VTRVTYLSKSRSFSEIALTRSSYFVPLGSEGMVTVYFSVETMLLFMFGLLKSSSLKTNSFLLTLAIVSKTALASSILPYFISSLGDSDTRKAQTNAVNCIVMANPPV